MDTKIWQFRKTLLLILGFFSLCANGWMFWTVWSQQYASTANYYRNGYFVLFGLYMLLLFFISYNNGAYRAGYFRVSELIFSHIISLCLTNGVEYLQISLIDGRLVPVGGMLWLTLMQVVFSVFWAVLATRIYFLIYPPRRMVLVYQQDSDKFLIGKIHHRADKYSIEDTISIGEGMENVKKKILQYHAVVLSEMPDETRNELMRFCFKNDRRAYIVPSLTDIMLGNASTINLFDTPLLLCRNRSLTYEQRLLKRLMDLVISAVGILIASPFMLAVALAVKLYDGGPVLFKQDRLTKDGKVFRLYKFRSMVVDAEKDGVARLATQHDERITPVGRVIRATRLDELPQLFNIFLGSMSLVGPRPERPEIAEQYLEIMPQFDYRLKFKAGLTGYAQVMGKYNTTPQDKLTLDLMYIESYSILLDLKILLLTIKTVFVRESTEGIDEKATIADRPIEAADMDDKSSGQGAK